MSSITVFLTTFQWSLTGPLVLEPLCSVLISGLLSHPAVAYAFGNAHAWKTPPAPPRHMYMHAHVQVRCRRDTYFLHAGSKGKAQARRRKLAECHARTQHSPAPMRPRTAEKAAGKTYRASPPVLPGTRARHCRFGAENPATHTPGIRIALRHNTGTCPTRRASCHSQDSGHAVRIDIIIHLVDVGAILPSGIMIHALQMARPHCISVVSSHPSAVSR